MLIEKILELTERGYDVTLTSDHHSETVTVIVMKGKKATRHIISEAVLYTTVYGPSEYICLLLDGVVEEMEK